MEQAKSKNKILHTCNTKNGIIIKYEDSRSIVKTIEMSVSWYFAIKKTDEEKLKNSVKNIVSRIEIDPKFSDYLKIYPELEKDRRGKFILFLEENGIETFEGDLMDDKRWYIDKEIEIASTYRKLYFDIETDDTIEKIEIGQSRILSYAAVDSDGKKYFSKISEHTDGAERELLGRFSKLIENYDLLLGWNSSGFDVPYLKTRMKLLDVRCDWKMIGKFDLLKRFRHIFRFDSHIRSFSLEFIAQHFLEKGKIGRSEKVIDLWKSDPNKLKRYNIEDSILVKELDEKLGVSEMMIRQANWCGVPATQFGLYTIIDAHIMKTAHRHGQFCKTSVRAIKERNRDNERGNENPSDTSSEKGGKVDKAKYSGAIVLDPIKGVYNGVHVFDFKGLYPSMMRTSNIGYDTLRNEANTQNGRFIGNLNRIINPGTQQIPRKTGEVRPTYFEKNPSVINLAITELITKRSEYKKLKLKMIEEGTNKGPLWERVVSDEIIVKELSNSTYGIMGLEYGRYFSVDVAESITLFGQWCILFAKQFFENEGYQVIYGDTDSVFVHTPDKFNIEEMKSKFHTVLKSELKNKYNIDENFIELEFDKKYKTLILIEKKTYVGHVINIEGKKTDDIYARGLEYHKKNTFSFAAKKQKELIEFILYKHPKKDEIQTLIIDIRNKFFAKDFTKEELSITQKVGKYLDEYTGKTPPLHVRLAMDLNKKTGQNLRNTEIEYIITDHQGKMNGILTKDFTGKFDREYYWSNKTQPLLERVANTAYPGFEWFNPTLSLFE